MAIEVYAVELTARLKDETGPALRRLERQAEQSQTRVQRAFDDWLKTQPRAVQQQARLLQKQYADLARVQNQAAASSRATSQGAVRSLQEQARAVGQVTSANRQALTVAKQQENVLQRVVRTVTGGGGAALKGQGIAGAIGNAIGGLFGGAKGLLGKVGGAAGGVLGGIKNFVGGLFSLPGLIATAVGGAAVKGGILDPIAQAAAWEQTEVAFKNFLGSASAAKAFLADLTHFAQVTPFNLTDVVEGARQLMAYGFGQNQVLPMLTAIGDAASALGIGAEGIDRMTRALGQMQAKGKVSAQEMMQLTETGLPAWDLLLKGYQREGVAIQDVAELMKLVEQGAVPARRSIRLLLEEIERDPRFASMMEEQSKTLAGMWSNIQDTFDQIRLSWGQGLAEGAIPILKDLTDWLSSNDETVTSLKRNLKDFGATLSGAVAGGVRAVVRGLGDLTASDAWKQGNWLDRLGLIGGKVTDVLLGAQNQAGQREGGVFGFLRDWLSGLLQGAWSAIQAWAGERWKDFLTLTQQIWDQAVATFKQWSDTVVATLNKWSGDAIARLQQFADDALAKFQDLVDWFKTKFVPALLDGIKGMFLSAGPTAQTTAGQTAAAIAGGVPGGAIIGPIAGAIADAAARTTGGPGAAPAGAAGATQGISSAAAQQSPLGPKALQAAQSAIAQGMQLVGSQNFVNWCLKFVDDQFNAGKRYGTAWQAAQARSTSTGGRLEDVPYGMNTYFKADPSNQGAGHVMMSLGGGKFLDPSYKGVRITQKGDDLWDYYSKLYYGYGPGGDLNAETMKLAGGGTLFEPLFGVGARSGRPYTLGERGPETVSPGTAGGQNAVSVQIGPGAVQVSIAVGGLGDLGEGQAQRVAGEFVDRVLAIAAGKLAAVAQNRLAGA